MLIVSCENNINNLAELQKELQPKTLNSGLKKAIQKLAITDQSSKNIQLVHLSPNTLGSFAKKINEGFIGDNNTVGISKQNIPIKSTLFIANKDELPTAFATRVESQIRDADIILLEVHAAGHEVRILEDIVKKTINGKLIVLIHRPEELLLRIKKENTVSTEEAKKILVHQLARADAIVVLGESTIARYAKLLPNKTVVAIFHPYFSAELLPQTPHRYETNSVVIIGSNTSWGELREIEDTEALVDKINSRIKAIAYVAGRFQPQNIDMGNYIKRQHDDVLFMTNEMFINAKKNKEFSDEASFRQWLYTVSDNGKKLIIRGIINPQQNSFVSVDYNDEKLGSIKDWEKQLIDFNLQLYKENLSALRDNNHQAPKEEYSGTLHQGLANIFVVLKSPTMDDVRDAEGLQMIEVVSQTRRPDFTQAAEQIIALVNNPKQRLEILKNNIHVAQSHGIESAAYGYYLLSQYLLE